MDIKNRSACTLDWTTVDGITKTALTDTRDGLREELDNFYNNEPGVWIHESDVVLYEKVIRSIDFLLTNWYGTE